MHTSIIDFEQADADWEESIAASTSYFMILITTLNIINNNCITSITNNYTLFFTSNVFFQLSLSVV